MVVKYEDHCEVSIYDGELTQENVVGNVKKIMVAFPQLEKGFYDIFYQRIHENEFSDEKLTAAVNHVIDNCVYPTPTIANFLSYDKRVRLYTYYQVIGMIDEYRKDVFKIYRLVKIKGFDKPFYARVDDIENYGLTLWRK
mgnify:CR=1 FL=1